MCKPWPGLRCTDHPQQKLIKYSQQIENKETELLNIDNLLHEVSLGLDEEHLADDAAWVKLSKQREKLLESINSINEKREEQILHYATTKGGQEEFKKQAEDATRPATERMESAAEQLAGETRRNEQLKLGKVLNNKDLDPDTKLLAANAELNASRKSIKQLKHRTAALKTSITELQHHIDAAKEAGHKEEAKALALRKSRQLAELSLLDKQLKQKEAKKEELKRWIARLYEKNINHTFNLTDKLIRNIFRLAW